MIRILLLGGTGFIGEYLAKSLHKRNDCEILIAGRGSSLRNALYKDTEVIVVLTQPDKTVMEGVINFIKSSKLLRKILYCSTLLLYPPGENSEEVLPDPLTAYEKAKFEEELTISEATGKSGCKLCIVRLANIYGNVKNRGIINHILLSLRRGDKDLIIQGDPKLKIRDYIFVEDAANLLELLIFYDQQKQKEIFNICSGVGTSVSHLIDKIESVSRKKISFKVGDPVLEKKAVVGNSSKILNLTRYKFKFDLTEGLDKTYKNYLKSHLV